MKTITSKDGTTIAFDQFGHGAALILAGGALEHRALQTETAKLAAVPMMTQFTVIHYDRRGRGDSTDTQPYAVERAIRSCGPQPWPSQRPCPRGSTSRWKARRTRSLQKQSLQCWSSSLPLRQRRDVRNCLTRLREVHDRRCDHLQTLGRRQGGIDRHRVWLSDGTDCGSKAGMDQCLD